MKEKFDWYIRPSDEEVDDVWSRGILTVDANVLLDLYRYSDKTRADIIKAIELFENRVWLSSQASREFIRNRKTVIASAERTFREAESIMSDIKRTCDAAVEKLYSHRLVPRDGVDEMMQAIRSAVDVAEQKISDARQVRPDYFLDDPLLDKILSIFDGRVGIDPSEVDWAEIRKEAEARRARKQPPGYLDSDKEGDRKYGDYVLWKQIIEQSRDVNSPMILVTSERKEDWWEKQSGRTVGPRIELLEEASIVSGQRILIYQTDNFLKKALSKIGDQVDDSSVEDIRDIDAERSLRQSLDKVAEAFYQEPVRVDMARVLEPSSGGSSGGEKAGSWSDTLKEIGRGVFAWVTDKNPTAIVSLNRGWPDVVVDGPLGKIGYEVLNVTTPSSFIRRVTKEMESGRAAVEGGAIGRHEIVAVAPTTEQLEAVSEVLAQESFELPESVMVTLGSVRNGSFAPVCRVSQAGRRKSVELF